VVTKISYETLFYFVTKMHNNLIQRRVANFYERFVTKLFNHLIKYIHFYLGKNAWFETKYKKLKVKKKK